MSWHSLPKNRIRTKSPTLTVEESAEENRQKTLGNANHFAFPVLILHYILISEDFLKVLYIVARFSIVVRYCMKTALSTPVAANRNKCFQKRLYVKPCKTKALAVLWVNFKNSLL